MIPNRVPTSSMSLPNWFDLLEEFESAWQNGHPPSVASFLKSRLSSGNDPEPGEHHQLLEELIKIDLECRWRHAGSSAGADSDSASGFSSPTVLAHGPLLELYLRICPQLGSLEQLSCELIAEEYRVRQRWGDRPTQAEYLARFPRQAAHLPDLLAKEDRELRAEGVDVSAREPLFPEPPSGTDKGAVVESPAPASAADSPEDKPLPRIPKYENLTELAKGGMGVVYRAFDLALNRDVAVKILADKYRASGTHIIRFLEEARITAQLQHPAIPPVHEIGTLPDGSPFLVMKLIKGQTLEQLMKERPDPAHDRGRFLTVFEQACQAVGYAHSRGVLHRDLKPSNVMVGAFGEVQVMDWGLAKVQGRADQPPAPVRETVSNHTAIRDPRSDSGGSKTEDGTMLGTPAYLAPEQAAGAVDEIDARADVFGLGSILCVLLTGQPPYVADSAEAIRRLALRGKLDDACDRLDHCGADPELVDLAKRCLAVEPCDRPEGAGTLAAELARLRLLAEERARQAELDRVEAEAQREKALTRVAEEGKRRKIQLALAATLLVLVAGAGVGAWEMQRQARERERRHQVQRVAAETALVEVRELRKRGLWKQANGLLLQAQRQLGPDGDDELRQQLIQSRRNLEFLAKLDRIRQEKVTIVERVVDGVLKKDLDRSMANPEYAAVFREYGLDFLAGEPEELSRQLKDSPVAEQLISAVDDWALDEKQPQQRDRLDQIAAAASGDHWRQELLDVRQDPQELKRRAEQMMQYGGSPAQFIRLARVLDEHHLDSLALLEAGSRFHPRDFSLHFERAIRYHDPSRQQFEAAAGAYHAALALQPDSIAVWNNFGDMLLKKGDFDGAVSCYRTALRGDPKHAKIHNNLGCALRARGDLDKAIACLRAAVQLDPKLAEAHANLGAVLHDRRDLDGAQRCFRTAIQLAPRLVQAHFNLGIVLTDKGDKPGAIDCYRKAIQLDPKQAPTHHNLGVLLRETNDLDGAIASFRTAIRLDPKFARPYINLGTALVVKPDLDGAIDCFRKAVQADPKMIEGHNNLGLALQAKNDLAGAEDCFWTALKLDPKHAQAYYNLGMVLKARGDREGAIRAFRSAVRFDPKSAEAHTNLGVALHEKRDLDGAINCFRKAINLAPNLFQPHYNLGIARHDKKDFDAALVSFRKASQLQPEFPGLMAVVSMLERRQELAAKVQAVLGGKKTVHDARECIELARYCAQYEDRYQAALRFYRDAVAANPNVATDQQNQYRYDAACWAALAAAGKGTDAHNLSKEKATELREQALSWLREDLSMYRQSAAKADSQLRQVLTQRLRHWQQDTDLASLRDKDRLESLPDTERQEWAKFWKQVAELRKQLLESK
jgi:tetratricopeptide (TPR) repeat protein